MASARPKSWVLTLFCACTFWSPHEIFHSCERIQHHSNRSSWSLRSDRSVFGIVPKRLFFVLKNVLIKISFIFCMYVITQIKMHIFWFMLSFPNLSYFSSLLHTNLSTDFTFSPTVLSILVIESSTTFSSFPKCICCG